MTSTDFEAAENRALDEIETIDRQISELTARRRRLASRVQMPETNEQFIARIMSSGSPLAQAFVIEAVAKYATACAKEPAETFDSPLLHGAAWVAIAKEIRNEIEKRDGGRS